MEPLGQFSPMYVLVTQFADQEEEKTILKLVRAFRNNTLTAQEALNGIASIAALRSLVAEMDARLNKVPRE